jgi:hypothetical protein
MKDDPHAWLNGHIVKGVHLRNKGGQLRKGDRSAIEAWQQQAQAWLADLRYGIAARCSADTLRVEVANEFPPLNLPTEHPWYEPLPAGLALTATGEGWPGNNPLSRLAAHIKQAEKIAEDWRATFPPTVKSAPINREHAVAIEEAKKFWEEDLKLDYTKAARKAVKLHGQGPHNSANAAVDDIRKRIGNLYNAGLIKRRNTV